LSWADLHLHSRWSDGEWAPRKLVRSARRAKLGAVSITDHDDVRAFPEAQAAGEELGVEILSGVEISTWRAGVDTHILGYGFDPADPGLERLFAAARAARGERAERMVDRLGALGMPIALDDVRRIAGSAAVGRPHVAQALVEAGFVSGHREAFDRWLGDGKPACVEKLRVTPAEAIAMVHAAGGVAVCAHPATLGRTEALDELVEAGLDGVEVRHGLHGAAAEAAYDAYAREHGLVRTGGSDFHGPRLGSTEPGATSIPREWWDALLSRIEARREAAGRNPRGGEGG
jgi:predicted metal-dependent phosphoesterase TrpH